jgi:hypothetical protein
MVTLAHECANFACSQVGVVNGVLFGEQVEDVVAEQGPTMGDGERAVDGGNMLIYVKPSVQ